MPDSLQENWYEVRKESTVARATARAIKIRVGDKLYIDREEGCWSCPARKLTGLFLLKSWVIRKHKTYGPMPAALRTTNLLVKYE